MCWGLLGRTRLAAAETNKKHSPAGFCRGQFGRNQEFEYTDGVLFIVVLLMQQNIEFEIMHCISKLLVRRLAASMCHTHSQIIIAVFSWPLYPFISCPGPDVMTLSSVMCGSWRRSVGLLQTFHHRAVRTNATGIPLHWVGQRLPKCIYPAYCQKRMEILWIKVNGCIDGITQECNSIVLMAVLSLILIRVTTWGLRLWCFDGFLGTKCHVGVGHQSFEATGTSREASSV